MTDALRLALIANATRRAHLYGAEASPEARRRYFRELAAIDTLQGLPSPFMRLG